MRGSPGFRTVLVLALVAVGVAAMAAEGQKVPRVAQAAFGEPFPPSSHANLNPGVGGARVDLGAVLGKKPVVLFYFIPSHARSEAMLDRTVEMLKSTAGDAVALYAVTAVAAGQDPAPITERIRSLGLTVPVLMDENFQLGQRLAVQVVPSITMIDASGRLRLANAASLEQDLEYKMKVKDGLVRLAKSGTVGTYGSLPRYDPAVELVGKKAPDFVAPGTDGIVRKWSTLLDPRKLNVLIYWSVECPHCRKSLPEINDWVRANGDGINVVSAAKVENEAMKVRTKEFVKLHGFTFPTVLDVDSAIFDAYQVTATPTVFVVLPDGTVEALLSAHADFGSQIEAKKHLLATAKTTGS